jgi:chromosome segregation ATPase
MSSDFLNEIYNSPEFAAEMARLGGKAKDVQRVKQEQKGRDKAVKKDKAASDFEASLLDDEVDMSEYDDKFILPEMKKEFSTDVRVRVEELEKENYNLRKECKRMYDCLERANANYKELCEQNDHLQSEMDKCAAANGRMKQMLGQRNNQMMQMLSDIRDDQSDTAWALYDLRNKGR